MTVQIHITFYKALVISKSINKNAVILKCKPFLDHVSVFFSTQHRPPCPAADHPIRHQCPSSVGWSLADGAPWLMGPRCGPGRGAPSLFDPPLHPNLATFQVLPAFTLAIIFSVTLTLIRTPTSQKYPDTTQTTHPLPAEEILQRLRILIAIWPLLPSIPSK